MSPSRPCLTDEESQDLFEANLPLAGVLPLRVELGYESGVPVEIKKARFRLRDGAGKEWKLLNAEASDFASAQSQRGLRLQSKFAKTI